MVSGQVVLATELASNAHLDIFQLQESNGIFAHRLLLV
jgi:hypothetical protein